MGKDAGPLEDAVKNFIKGMSGEEKVGEEEIFGAWENAAGGAAAKHSRPVSLKKSSLTVNVDGSSWLYELTTHKKEILEKINLSFKNKKIKEIRLRIGEIK